VFHPIQLASFALMQFQHGLQGLTEEEAQVRLKKADGSQMNAISWTVGHVCWQWIRLATRVALAQGKHEGSEDPYPMLRERVRQFQSGSQDPTPPTLQYAMDLLRDTTEVTKWLIDVDDDVMSTIQWGNDPRDGGVVKGVPETLGTSAIRNTLHTWFHIGEINAVRQMLGHEEILFIIMMSGNLEWLPDGEPAPAWVDYPPPLAPHDADLIERYNQLLPARS
jgi:hypothetical protein